MERQISLKWWKNDALKGVTIGIILLHMVALCAFMPRFFSWSGVTWFFFFYWISGGLGITLCYHRLLTHKSFKTHKWLRFLLTSFGCLAFQGTPIDWVGTHRFHHLHSDKDTDPHSPQHGGWWAHLIWVCTKPQANFVAENQALDLKKEKMMLWFERFWFMPQIIVSILLFGGGFLFDGFDLAVSWLVWGVALRTVVVFHVTWFVNSVTHMWGYQNFTNTGDNSRNLWWVALLSFGEGWHNNHHAEPSSAAHGMCRFEIDPTYITIKFLEFLGLAWNVKKPSKIFD